MPIEFCAILACSNDMCIGANNDLPWPHLRSDMRWFAKLTKFTDSPQQKNAVIMGRRTWESLPVCPLKNRINIVVSSSMHKVNWGGAYFVNSLEEALEYAESRSAQRVFCIGGAQLFDHALKHPLCKYLFVTRINLLIPNEIENKVCLSPKLLQNYKMLSHEEFTELVPFVQDGVVVDTITLSAEEVLDPKFAFGGRFLVADKNSDSALSEVGSAITSQFELQQSDQITVEIEMSFEAYRQTKVRDAQTQTNLDSFEVALDKNGQ